jgi:hypothetical protein
MDQNLAQILGQTGLPEEIIESLQAAFDAKVAEAREEAEMSIREEMSARFEHDKNNLVEAMDRMLSDVVEENAKTKAAEVAKLSEARTKYEAAVVEARTIYRNKLKEHFGTTNSFVVQQLTKSIKALAEQKTAVVAKQKKLDEQFEKVKADVAAQNAARMQKIDEFVIRQVSRELNEFQTEHRALVEARVKFAHESKRQLAETRTKFIKESAAKVEAAVNANMKREMAQLHEDLERNRQNTFGRRIFEAVAAEFMTSYLAEGSEIRNLQNVLESKETELASAKSRLSEAAKALEGVTRKVKLAEDRAARTKIMSELLSNLRGEKKSVMESMLETTKTEHLRGAFDKLLPVVLAEGTRKPVEKRVLSEQTAPRRPVVTGDKPSRLFEAATVETSENEESSELVAQIVRLAGLQK